MTTRLDIWRECDQRREVDGEPACALITCCSDPDKPSSVDYARRLVNPRAKCVHPDGDKWRDAELPPGLPSHAATKARSHEGKDVSLVVLMLTERAGCCKGNRERERCAEHFTSAASPWGCAAVAAEQESSGTGEQVKAHGSNDIRPLLKRPSWACPRGHFAAVETASELAGSMGISAEGSR